MGIPIPTGVRQLLEAPNYVHLSTLRADGSPRNWVVWVGLEGDHILICTSESVWKAKDMRRDPRVGLSVTDLANPYRMATIQGRVVEIRPDDGARHMDPISMKYTSAPFPSRGPDRVCFVIAAEKAHQRTLSFVHKPGEIARVDGPPGLGLARGASDMPGYPQAITPVDHVEPVPRRIRAVLAGRTVLDTNRAVYLWEWPYYPQFHIPADDVDRDVLVDEQHTNELSRGTVARIGLRVGEAYRAGAGRRYLESSVEELVGTIRFEWDALDAWYEEDEQVFVHPRNPYVRVDALRSRRRVRIERDGVVLADSASPVMVFETGLPTRYYLDRSAVAFSHLPRSETITACPYKGRTTEYWSVQVGESLYPDLAWSYDFPTRELQPIAGLVAFYDEQVDVFIDGVEQPRPQTHFFK